MKRSGFKRPKFEDYEFVQDKPRKRAKNPVARLVAPKKGIRKAKLPSIKTVRNKCDALLTPIVKSLYPHCLLCGFETQVAHHHVHKSSSNRLRYEILNLINLCNKCHCALHNNESYYASKIILIKGTKWFEEIERLKRETVKADVHWYLENYTRLSNLQKGS